MKLLYLTDTPPDPETRHYELLELLHELVTHPAGPKLEVEVVCYLGRTHPTPFSVSQFSPKKGWLQRTPPAMAKALRDRSPKSTHTAVFVSGKKVLNLVPLLSELGFTVLVEGDDFHSENLKLLKALSHHVDHFVVSSELSATRLARMGASETGTSIAVVPHGVDYADFAQTREAEGGPTLLIPGPFDSDAAVRNLKWMAREILPKLRAQIELPSIQCIGRPPTDSHFTSRMERLGVHFRREDPKQELLKEAGVIFVPLLRSTPPSLRPTTRILEAMASGRAVVATGAAIDGLVVAPSYNIVVSDSPDSLVTSLLKLLQDASYRRQLGDRAAETVRKNYDWSVAGQKLETLLKSVFGPSLTRDAAKGPTKNI